eukprot:498582_1
MRVYIAFKGTQYEINKCLYVSLWFLIIISILASCWHVAIMLFIKNEDTETALKRPAFIVLMTNDAFLNITLFILFIYKLRSVSIASESMSDISNAITFQTTKTLHLITRHSLLFGVAILSNQLFYTSGYIISFYPTTNNVLIGIVYQLRALENIVNVMVLYLSMTINNEIYRNICSFCHNNVMKCCTKSVQKATDYYRLQSI